LPIIYRFFYKKENLVQVPHLLNLQVVTSTDKHRILQVRPEGEPEGLWVEHQSAIDKKREEERPGTIRDTIAMII